MTDQPDRPDPQDQPDRPDSPAEHGTAPSALQRQRSSLAPVLVRGPIPAEWADLLDHLAVDLRRSRPQLVTEGILLLLRFHQRGHGLPEPLPALGQKDEEGDR